MPSRLVIESSYDAISDARYIRLGTADRSGSGTQEVLGVGPAGCAIILDLDARGRVVGIEMLNQSTLLAHPIREQFATDYDPEVDAAWIALVEGRPRSKRTEVIYDVGSGQLLADFDGDGRVLDFEILDVKMLIAAPTFM